MDSDFDSDSDHEIWKCFVIPDSYWMCKWRNDKSYGGIQSDRDEFPRIILQTSCEMRYHKYNDSDSNYSN